MHPWAENHEDYAAVIVRDGDTDGIDIEDSDIAFIFQRMQFSLDSSGDEGHTFTHIDTSQVVLCDGAAIALEHGSSQLEKSLPDLMCCMMQMGWEKVRVYTTYGESFVSSLKACYSPTYKPVISLADPAQDAALVGDLSDAITQAQQQIKPHSLVSQHVPEMASGTGLALVEEPSPQEPVQNTVEAVMEAEAEAAFAMSQQHDDSQVVIDAGAPAVAPAGSHEQIVYPAKQVDVPQVSAPEASGLAGQLAETNRHLVALLDRAMSHSHQTSTATVLRPNIPADTILVVDMSGHKAEAAIALGFVDEGAGQYTKPGVVTLTPRHLFFYRQMEQSEAEMLFTSIGGYATRVWDFAESDFGGWVRHRLVSHKPSHQDDRELKQAVMLNAVNENIAATTALKQVMETGFSALQDTFQKVLLSLSGVGMSSDQTQAGQINGALHHAPGHAVNGRSASAAS